MENRMKWSNLPWCLSAMVLIAAIALSGPAYTGKPVKGEDPPPPNSWIAYIGTNNQGIHLSDGVESGLLLSTEGHCGVPSWSPDGSELALSMQDSNGNWGIYGVPTDGSGGSRLICPFIMPGYVHYTVDWSESPTATGSEMILFSDYPLGEDPPGAEHNEVYAVNPDGTGLVRLTFEEGPVDVSGPVWSPDATRFTAVRFDEQASNFCELRIYEVGLENGELAVINETPIAGMAGGPLEGEILFFPDWSHDGNWIVVSAPVEFYRINVANPFDVVQLTFPEHGHQRWAHFTPDDSQIIFSRYVKEKGVKGYKLHTINSTDGSGLIRILNTGHAEDRIGIRPF